MAGLFSAAEVPHAEQRAGPLLAHGLAKELNAPLGAAAAGLVFPEGRGSRCCALAHTFEGSLLGSCARG